MRKAKETRPALTKYQFQLENWDAVNKRWKWDTNDVWPGSSTTREIGGIDPNNPNAGMPETITRAAPPLAGKTGMGNSSLEERSTEEQRREEMREFIRSHWHPGIDLTKLTHLEDYVREEYENSMPLSPRYRASSRKSGSDTRFALRIVDDPPSRVPPRRKPPKPAAAKDSCRAYRARC